MGDVAEMVVVVAADVFVLLLGVVVETLAVFVSEPACVGSTTTVTVALPPAARLPRLAVTVPPDWTAVPRLDALPALRAALPGPDVFFRQTVHLTPRGHEIVAKTIDEFLRKQGI